MSIKIKRKRERSFVSFLQFNYHFSFLCANFVKTEVRSHSFPRPLSAGEKRAEAKRKILFPQKNCFSVLPSEARRWRGFLRAYDLVSSNPALRAWHIICFENRF